MTNFQKNTQILHFVKILLVRAELFHVDEQRADRQTDRQTDMTKLIIALGSLGLDRRAKTAA